MKYLYVLIALLLIPAAIPATSVAQRTSGTLTGVVLDADTDTPITSATVGVWQARDSILVTGGISDVDGRFAIEGLRNGQYYVQVSFVGYRTETITDVALSPQAPRVDIGSISLRPDTQVLDEVEITAERASVQIEIDRTVYNTADNPVAVGGTATNVLETIPSVDVDVDGNVSLRGSGNVAILINGRPAPVSAEFISAYLKQLPAGTIDRVEVIPNPSARYEPDGMGGILNIVLKEEVDRGLGGTVSVGGDRLGGYNGTGTLTYGRGDVNIAASYGFRQEEGNSGGDSYRINRYSDPLTYLDQDEVEDESETGHQFSLSGDYRLTPKTALNASAQLGLRDELEKENNLFLFLDASEDPTLEYERLVEEGSSRWNTDFRLGLTHNFAPQQAQGQGRERGPRKAHELTIEARFNADSNDGEELYREQLLATTELRQLQRALTDRGRQRGSLQIDYVRPLGEFRLETGYKGDLELMDSDLYSETQDIETGEFVPDVGLINTFDFDQNIHAAYGQLAREWGPLGVQLGVRLESATTTFTLRNTSEDYDNDYFSAFPSAFFTYELTEKHVLRASYSRRINRPRTWFLNPFPSYDDPLNIRMGNPALRPEYVDAIEAGYVRYTDWGSVSLTPFYRRTTDVIRRLQELREDGVTVRTVKNFDTSSSSGIELITSLDELSFLDGLRGYASLEGFRVVTDGTNVDTELQNNAFGWGGRLNLSYAIGNIGRLGGLDFQTTVRYRAPMDTEQGRVEARAWSDMALRQELFSDRASLSIRVRDVFGTAGFGFTIDQPTLYQEFSRSRDGQRVGVTFSYTFGKASNNNRRRGGDREGGPDGGGGGGDDMGGLEG